MNSKRTIKPALILALAFLCALCVSAVPAFAAVYVMNSWARVSATAGENLAIGDIACIASTDGKAYKADADNPARRPAVGIVSRAASTNTVVAITSIGQFGGYSTLTQGAPVYLSATAGALTQTATTNWAQQIGWAKTDTIYYFDFSMQPFSSMTLDSTSHTANNGTTDGTSVAVPAGALGAGKLLRITAGGTITGANAAKSVILYIDDAAILTMSTTTVAAGDWYAQFVMGLSGSANQKCFGVLIAGPATGATAADAKTVYAADTTDFSGAKTVKLQVVSAHGSDTIVQEYGIVEFLP